MVTITKLRCLPLETPRPAAEKTHKYRFQDDRCTWVSGWRVRYPVSTRRWWVHANIIGGDDPTQAPFECFTDAEYETVRGATVFTTSEVKDATPVLRST
jgi:hypothetical protein